MRLVLDSGGVSALAGQRARLAELRLRDLWPAQVPLVVLAEVLTGDHRRDHAVNRLLRACLLVELDEVHAREAARLRTRTGRSATISAVDAVVAAHGSDTPGSTILTSDPEDLRALMEHAEHPAQVVAV